MIPVSRLQVFPDTKRSRGELSTTCRFVGKVNGRGGGGGGGGIIAVVLNHSILQ